MQPEQLGPFRIERVLGRGGMGAVYEGVHVETGETAAVKVLLTMLEDDEELRLRFEAEIDTLKRLRHPNIVRLYGFGEEQGLLYYVMELVDGPSLQQEMKKRRVFDWSEAAKIGLEMCSALKHAHDRGITHRDIKPANILLEQHGTTKLSDYGIAQLFDGDRLTNANSVVGTLEYMSPEQALANPVGPRSDLYSLGAVLYAILVGKPPFSAKSLGEILRKHQNNTPDPIRASRLDVPDELEAIILDLLKPKQEDRPNNAYMAGKRFQSLLQALVGPPEKILVRPVGDDNVLPPASLGAISLPDDDLPERVGRARGVVAEGGIIDLGGIVRDERFDDVDLKKPIVLQEETIIASTAEEADDLLEKSFGNPAKNSRFSGSSDDFELSDVEEHAEFLNQEFRRRGIPSPVEIAARDNPSPLPMVDEIDSSIDSNQKKSLPGTKKWAKRTDDVGSPTRFSPGTPFGSPIRHGEIVWENQTGFRRAKDEPIPEQESFEALYRSVDPPVDDVLEPVANAERDKATEWTNRQTPDPVSKDAEKRPESVSSAPFLTGPSLPIPESVGSKAPVAKRSSSDETNKPAAVDVEKSSHGTTRFVSVSDDDLGGFGEGSRPTTRPMSLQTILTSICLVLTGLLIYYLLQPVPAEELFARIKEIVREDDSGDYSVPSLRQAERDIDSFLNLYSQHPKADIVRDYKDELDLADKEQKLLRRQAFSKPSALGPAEWAYLEAISYSRTDPEKEMLKLQALVDLFDVDSHRTHDDFSVNRRLSTENERCVELARRRLKKLETEFATIKNDLVKKLETRLNDAERIQSENPKRADEIRRGLIELYRDRDWAAPLVERAKKSLASPETSDAPRVPLAFCREARLQPTLRYAINLRKIPCPTTPSFQNSVTQRKKFSTNSPR